MTLSRHAALLRGINVGGKNLLPMKGLAAMFVEAGCGDVTTYIQSGNVVFRADTKVAKSIGALISKQVEEQLDLKVPVVVRTLAEMEDVVRGNPFLLAGADEDMLHVSFLADLPTKAQVDGLDPGRSVPDEFQVIGREIYLKLPNGAARTKLTNAYFDTKLKTVSTMRNWRTVLKLTEMMTAR